MYRDVARIFGLGGEFRLQFEPKFAEAKKITNGLHFVWGAMF